MSIVFNQTGDFGKLDSFLKRAKKKIKISDLDQYGKLGVEALSEATPTDTGLTADSWSYEITQTKDRVALTFTNSNIQNGVPIAVILQYGHATGSGGWVEGRDYINPAIRPIFDKIAEDAWKEVSKS